MPNIKLAILLTECKQVNLLEPVGCRNNKFIDIHPKVFSTEDRDVMPNDKNAIGNPIPLCSFSNQYIVYLLNGSMYFMNSSWTFCSTKQFWSISWLIEDCRDLDKERLRLTCNVRRVLHEIDLIRNTSVSIIDFKELLCCVVLQPSSFRKCGNFHLSNANL